MLSNYSFCHNVFKSRLLQMCRNTSADGKRFMIFGSFNIYPTSKSMLSVLTALNSQSNVLHALPQTLKISYQGLYSTYTLILFLLYSYVA